MKALNYITLLVAMAISACAAYYSIVGLTSIFASAFWSIIIMGSVLELGKLTTAVWLHINWKSATWWMRTYMIPAAMILMLITSMGIFGFLSKAHIEQLAAAGDVTIQVEQLDLDIKSQQDKVDSARKLMSQLDAAVDGLIATANKQGQQARANNAKQAGEVAKQATELRKSQAPEREALQKQITEASDVMSGLNKNRLVFQHQTQKLEAEVGPVRYIAQLIYGDNPDRNTLEKAVRWVIILLVVVFDPLAIVLILAATTGIREEDLKKNLI